MTTSTELRKKIQEAPHTLSMGFIHEDGNMTREVVAYKHSNGAWVLVEDAVPLIHRVLNGAMGVNKLGNIRIYESGYGSKFNHEWD